MQSLASCYTAENIFLYKLVNYHLVTSGDFLKSNYFSAEQRLEQSETEFACYRTSFLFENASLCVSTDF